MTAEDDRQRMLYAVDVVTSAERDDEPQSRRSLYLALETALAWELAVSAEARGQSPAPMMARMEYWLAELTDELGLLEEGWTDGS